jgi:hypothetical protein
MHQTCISCSSSSKRAFLLGLKLDGCFLRYRWDYLRTDYGLLRQPALGVAEEAPSWAHPPQTSPWIIRFHTDCLLQLSSQWSRIWGAWSLHRQILLLRNSTTSDFARARDDCVVVVENGMSRPGLSNYTSSSYCDRIQSSNPADLILRWLLLQMLALVWYKFSVFILTWYPQRQHVRGVPLNTGAMPRVIR